VYNDQPNELQSDRDSTGKSVDLFLMLGLRVTDEGTIADVVYDGPSYKAGIGPGMKITAVNGRPWSSSTMRESLANAIRDANGNATPIQLIVTNGADVEARAVDYHGGLRYAHLVRDESKPDYLSDILKPLTP
jgi:predicted metalloprotease with PDZ domain